TPSTAHTTTHKFKMYAILQFTGWGVYTLLTWVNLSQKHSQHLTLYLFLSGLLVFNLLVSHFYRWVIIRQKWVAHSFGRLMLNVFIATLFLGIVFSTGINALNLLFP